MSDSAPQPPDVNQIVTAALARLRGFAEGNGLAPDSIQLTDKNAALYTLTGKLYLTPKFAVETKQYTGTVRGKNRRVVPNLPELKQTVEREQQEFLASGTWFERATKELQSQAGQGWGLSDATIILPDYTPPVFAVTSQCPSCYGQRLLTCQQCNGNKNVICAQCQGRGQETCPNCYGRGEDPSNPQQRCHVCNGVRTVPCRFCRAAGQLHCPSCQGKGGTACTSCAGTGCLTDEVTPTATITTHFQLDRMEGTPSGLLRGIDRLGIANLAKGHATITMQPAEADRDKEGEAAPPILLYQVILPYADLKLRFGDARTVLVGCFGKRGALLNCPAFLDQATEKGREALEAAAMGEATLDSTLKFRLIKEAFELIIGGTAPNQSGVAALRKLYPIGLSPDTAADIMRNLGQALRRSTLRSRAITAAAALLLNTLLSAGYWLAGWRDILLKILPPAFVLAITLLLPALLAGLAWFSIGQSARWVLQRRYPTAKINLTQPIGKFGWSIIAVNVLIYLGLWWLKH